MKFERMLAARGRCFLLGPVGKEESLRIGGQQRVQKREGGEGNQQQKANQRRAREISESERGEAR